MKILKKNNDELEFENSGTIYYYYKDTSEDTNEDGDAVKDYSIGLTRNVSGEMRQISC